MSNFFLRKTQLPSTVLYRDYLLLIKFRRPTPFLLIMNIFNLALLFSFSFGTSVASRNAPFTSGLSNENGRWNLPVVPSQQMASTFKQSNEDAFKSKKNAEFLVQFPRGGDAATTASANADVLTQMYQWSIATPARCWALLMVAIGMEIVATAFMKYATDKNSMSALGAALLLYIVCLSVFGLTLAQIEMSVAYAVWSGLGTGLATAVGMFIFNEKRDPAKVACVAMILLGCVGLNLISSDH